MAEASRSPACILLLYGIPGSGKTMLSASLLEQCKRKLQGTAVTSEASQADREEGDGERQATNLKIFVVHFDEFYPPDTREQEGDSKSQFHQKQARQQVHSCLEHFIAQNNLSRSIYSQLTSKDAESDVSSSSQCSERSAPPDWITFLQSLMKHCSEPGSLDASGRIVGGEGGATVLLLDDNMPLRSMRYEYYQLARKYSLGYSEVCIQCSLPVALERNSRRVNPIPSTTIETMEQRMELPDPSHNRWEERSVIIRSDSCEQETFIRMAVAKILFLIEDTLKNPVQPLPEVDTALKETCKLANLNSYVHQADNILRKCISETMKKPPDPGGVPASTAKQAKGDLARRANELRKQLLEEIRAGYLRGKPLSIIMADKTATSEEFTRIITEAYFTTLLEK